MKRWMLSILFISLLLPSLVFGTVSDSGYQVQYACNGATVDFSFAFGVGATSEVQVILTTISSGAETTLTETTHYAVTCLNSDCTSGGTITTVATYSSLYKLTILRNVPLTQDADFTEGMPTLYETFESSLDKLTRITQQQQEQLDRSPKLAQSSEYSDLTLPDPQAGYYIRWNSAGDDLENTAGVESGTFTSSETGAVTRSVTAKLSDFVSVKDFGAKGDGTTDDSAAIQLALDLKQRVYLPAGNYHLHSPIVLKEGCILMGDGNSQNGTLITANTAIVIIKSYAVDSGVSEGYYKIKDLRIIGSSDLPTIGIQLGNSAATSYRVSIDNVTVQGCLIGAQFTRIQYSSFRDLTIEGDNAGDATYTKGLSLNAVSVSQFNGLEINGFVNNIYMVKSSPTFNGGSIWAESGETHTTSLVNIVNCKDVVFNYVVFENNMGNMSEILLDSTDTDYETNSITFNDCQSHGSAGTSNTATRFVIGVNAVGHYDVMNTVLNRHRFNWRYYVADVNVSSGKADGVTLNKCLRRQGFYGEYVLNPSVIGNLSASKVHIIPAEEFWAASPTSASTIASPWELGMRVYQSDALLSGTDGNQGWVVATPGSIGGGYTLTGDTDGATAVITGITLAESQLIPVGNYVSVTAGFPTTGPYKIIAATTSSITLDTNSNAIAAGITIETMAPVFGKIGGYKLRTTMAYGPVTVNAGATATQTVTVTGAKLGDIAYASHSVGFNLLMHSADVTADDTVTVRFYNPTGGNITIGAGYLRAFVEKQPAS